ncbi:MAG: 23S rRNA (uracil(1939)-C(5))-methyltransferase RlmD [Chlamydiae bacterium]|nr:23S rRNA (uracil(1939)-C(5))-methyltransferase RlmD [Chlamydiota bacterium]
MQCQHFGECGGCKTQNIPYEEQLNNKQKFIEELFFPHQVERIIPSPQIWEYRNKMEYTFSQDKAGKRFLGLFAKRGKVLTLQECLLTDPWYIKTKNAVYEWWEEEDLPAFHPRKAEGLLINLILRTSPSGGKMVNLLVSGNPAYALTRKQLDNFVAKVQSDQVSVFLTLKHAKEGSVTTYSEMHLAGQSYLTYSLAGLSYHLSPTSFFQPNNYTFPILCETALKMAQLTGKERVIDLFCGLGTLGLYFARHVEEVVGVEINKAAVADARDNAERSEIHNILFFAEDVSTFIRDYEELFDLAIVDPPRAGLEKKGVEALLQLKPKKILYISCNPKTQSEDLKALLPFYNVQKIQPLDQFPHTEHVENLLLLS